ncbi:MAG: HlyC/CorC family transporter [Gemmatimonadaceae bacterium]|nr:HlyC/CorC family transporter [Gemmatimonadaceae bacterium]
MTSVVMEIVLIVLLLLLNGVFAMSEMALVAARHSRLERRAELGDRGARAALQLAQNPTAFLSTVQVGITLAGILAGAYGGATIAQQLGDRLNTQAWIGRHGHQLALLVVVAGITYLSLVLGELAPKRLALGNPERVISLLARPMQVVSIVVRPLVVILTGSTNAIFRLFGLGTVRAPGVTEHDIRALVEQGMETGAVQRAEREIVENTFRLGDRTVYSIMTPRPDVEWVDLTSAASAMRTTLAGAVHERILICQGEIDQVVGVVRASDLLSRYLVGDVVDDAALLRQLAFAVPLVPASMPAFRLLETFRQTRHHTAVALDEYGLVAGIATLDDLLEALLDEVPAEIEGELPSMSRRTDGSWLVDAAVPIGDVANRLKLSLSEEERRGVVTLGGFVMAHLGRLPRAGDAVVLHGRRFEVVDMDRRRIDMVLISGSPDADGEPDGEASRTSTAEWSPHTRAAGTTAPEVRATHDGRREITHPIAHVYASRARSPMVDCMQRREPRRLALQAPACTVADACGRWSGVVGGRPPRGFERRRGERGMTCHG